MLLYVFKRLLLLIPSLLVISLLTFSLNQCTPSDDILSSLSNIDQGGDLVANAKTFRRQYRRELEKRSEHLPLFYCEITTFAHPDTLLRIFPIARQRALQQLLGSTGNWPAVSAYDQARDRLYLALLQQQQQATSDLLIDINQSLRQLEGNGNLSDIAQQLEMLDAKIEAATPPLTQAAFDQLQTSYHQLTTHKQRWQLYVPALQWHGTQSRYHRWLKRILQGDFGKSKFSGQAATEKVMQAVGWTLRINGTAIFIAFLLSIPLGVYSAVYAGTRTEQVLNLFLFLLYALPGFWVATMLGKFLTTPEWLNWFPAYGVGEVSEGMSWWTAFCIRLEHLFLPIVCLTYSSLAVITRHVRRSMIDALQSDYVRTARAKGIPESRVIWRHAFRNSLFPLITMVGNILPAAIAGAVIIEFIFSIPGVGWLTINSIWRGDWAIVYTLLLLIATATVIGILIADLLYAWADPRVRLTQKGQS